MRHKVQIEPKQAIADRTGVDTDSTAYLKKKIADGQDNILEPIFSEAVFPQKKRQEAAPKKNADSGERTTNQVSHPPVSKIKRHSRSVSTTSIKKALRGEFEDEKKQISAKEQFQIYSKAEENEPFTAEQLKEKWNAFLPRLNDRPSIKATLSTLPEIEKNWSLLLKIDNRIQDEFLANVKPELVSYLRKELRNSKINLKTEITKIVREKVIYTDTEKYQEMAKKNPNLALLKRTLGLDF